MILLSLASVNSINLAASGLMNSHLAHHLVGHEVLRTFISLIRGPRKSRFTRAQLRKLSNRRRRHFVDNIIMHHKRLHDKNRELAVSLAKNIILEKKAKNKNSTLENSRKWQDKVGSTKNRGALIRERVAARKSRAQSRWSSVVNS